MNLLSVLCIAATLTLLAMVAVPFNASFAESQTTVTVLDDELSIEETVMTLTISEDNTLPWAFVEGKIKNHAPDFPVIIQFFEEDGNNGDGPIHVAQTEVSDDGSYEYKFRVKDMDTKTGKTVNVFEGIYMVKIFKVVISQNDLDSA